MIGLHICSGAYWYDTPVQTSGWLFTNSYGSLTKWCVPVFVMISGMLFLSPARNVTSGAIFRKYLPRLLIAFLFWSAVYVAFTNREHLFSLDVNLGLLKEMLTQFVTGHYHMWYLYMIAGLYLITPFLRQITAGCSRRQLGFFLLLWCVFSVLLPALNLFSMPGVRLLNIASEKMSLSFVTGWVGYYLLGYYVSTLPETKKKQVLLPLLGLAGALFTVLLSDFLSLQTGTPNRSWHGNMAPGVFLMAVGLFSFFQSTVGKIRLPERAGRMVTEVGNCCFGIYLIHVLILFFLEQAGVSIHLCHPALSVPLTVVCTFLCSLLPVLLWRRIAASVRGRKERKTRLQAL